MNHNRLNAKIIRSINLIGSKDEFSLLEAGCGEGIICNLIKQNINDAKITGIDFSREAVEFAKATQPGINFLEGDIKQIQFDNETFDIVLCTEVLEHIKDPEIALREIVRVAKRYIIITVPHEPWFRLGNMIVLKNLTRFGNPIDHLNHWTYMSFKKFLEKELNIEKKFELCFPWITVILKKY